jgi:hypothetical protein
MSARLTYQRDHKQPTPSMHGLRGKALYYAIPALRVSHYFQVLALSYK